MASIYDINFNLQATNLLPPDKRKARFKAFLNALTICLQYLRDRFYNKYADGDNSAKWDSGTAYTIGQTVRYVDRSIYECIADTTAGILPTDTDYFIKVQDIYIGLRERLKYNSQKILFEYVLNKWFEVDPLPADQIYISNNSLDLNGFVIGEFEDTSSSIAQTENYQQGYLGNSYSFGSYAFTIYVPLAVFNALAATNTEREYIIRAQADKYVYSGFLYNVVTY